MGLIGLIRDSGLEALGFTGFRVGFFWLQGLPEFGLGVPIDLQLSPKYAGL